MTEKILRTKNRFLAAALYSVGIVALEIDITFKETWFYFDGKSALPYKDLYEKKALRVELSQLEHEYKKIKDHVDRYKFNK